VVDRDHGHSWVSLSDVYLDGRFRERGVDGRVDRDRVVRVRGAVAREIRTGRRYGEER
jgi:hypothetical protein